MVMDQRRSKKTRSHGESPDNARTSKLSGGPLKATGSGRRSSLSDRNRSASLAVNGRRGVAEVQASGDDSRTENEDVKLAGKFQAPALGVGNSQPGHVSQRLQAARPCQPPKSVDVNQPTVEVTIAVVGATAVGKSTFIRCALDLKQLPTSPASAKRMSLDGVVYQVRLLEVELDAVQITADQQVEWPGTVINQPVTQVDGALTLYDVMNKESITHLPELINAFSKSAIPCVLVSCKCDQSPDSRELDPRVIEQIGTSFGPGLGGVNSFETSADHPESQKRCISIVLRAIVTKESGATELSTPSLRKRASTSIQACGRAGSTAGPPKHGRSSSESVSPAYGGLMSGPAPAEQGCGDRSLNPKMALFRATSAAQPAGAVTTRLSLPQAAVDVGLDESNKQDSDTETLLLKSLYPAVSNLQRRERLLDSSSTDTSVQDYILDRDNAQKDVCPCPKENTISVRLSDEVLVHSSKDAGYAFDDLVDRLLAQPMSKSDSKYSAMFLCLYRKFAAPADLLAAIIDRFEALDKDNNPQVLRVNSQLRYLSIMAQWVAGYPGDFAHELTRRRMIAFITVLATNRVFAVAAKEMCSYLEVISTDDDTNWACSDADRERTYTTDTSMGNSLLQGSIPTLEANSPADDISNYHDCMLTGNAFSMSARDSATSSDSSILDRSESNPTGSVQTLLDTLESAQQQARLLVPVPRNPLTKLQWHEFMETPDDDIARELTRIDWAMFSSIRPRDLVRHVGSPAQQKGKCKSLEHIDRMIGQFNHVAYWVANMILLREKPKHRAKALEKIMSLAWKLRYLNNYNSLGAVIAGINGSAVLRLTQTRELVARQAQKDFMRLEILMGTQKSHFAYRLAWENTSSERIPFLPLHRRDLVSAEQGNKTFIGDRINWKKFEVMGEVIVGIQKSQGTQYPIISRNEDIQRLVLESRIVKDDDELYERSIQLEAPGGSEHATKKKFGWFQR